FGSKSEGEARAARDTSMFPASTPQTKPAHPAIATAGAMAPKFRSQPVNTKTASAHGPKPPAALPRPPASVEPQSPAESTTTALLKGAAPTVPTGSFDNRVGSWR